MVSTAAFAADMPQPLPQPPISRRLMVMAQPGRLVSARRYRRRHHQPIRLHLSAEPARRRQWLRIRSAFVGRYGLLRRRRRLRIEQLAALRRDGRLSRPDPSQCPRRLQSGHRPRRRLSRLSAVLGRARQCLCRFRHLGLSDAVPRRRHRRRLQQMADLVDMGIGTTGAGFGRNSTNWSPAYAFYAGLDYNVTKNFIVELSYRYLNYGSVTDTVDCVGGCSRRFLQILQPELERLHARACAGASRSTPGRPSCRPSRRPSWCSSPRRSTPSRRRSISPHRSISRPRRRRRSITRLPGLRAAAAISAVDPRLTGPIETADGAGNRAVFVSGRLSNARSSERKSPDGARARASQANPPLRLMPDDRAYSAAPCAPIG